ETFLQGITTGHQVAQDELLLTGWPQLSDPVVAGPAGSKGEPTAERHGKNLLQRRSVGRAEVGPAHYFYFGAREMSDGFAQAVRQRPGIVIEEINQFAL